jgi:hypothetical protein
LNLTLPHEIVAKNKYKTLPAPVGQPVSLVGAEEGQVPQHAPQVRVQRFLCTKKAEVLENRFF